MHPSSKVSQFIRISEDVFEKSAVNFGDSAHRIRRMKVLSRRSAALRKTRDAEPEPEPEPEPPEPTHFGRSRSRSRSRRNGLLGAGAGAGAV